ncbi:MAG: DEAD/DEAH box helicase, partial [Gemmatimonadota bacterium]
ARGYERVEIVAPSGLRAMWHEACSRCHVATTFIAAESLSRSRVSHPLSELVVVDEAHWFRNAHTKRYRQLASRCRRAVVLLLSATPLHNSGADIESLFALFLGVRAARLSPNERGELVVRRGRLGLESAATARVPHVAPTRWFRVRADRTVVAALNAIEAPVPPRDGGLALALLRLTLLRRYASSEAALSVTLQRMLARALAMRDAFCGGTYPTARELCAWLVNETDIQLALPGLLSLGAIPNEPVTLDALDRHIASVRRGLGALRSATTSDDRRAALLLQLVRKAGDAPVVAFSQYDATARALARRLRVPGVAVLTGKGARIASGSVTRATVLQQFDASRQGHVPPALRIRLLLATDLLSEGVNLHNAGSVVHLDVPWTAARLEQRVGRLSRMGSPHGQIRVFGFAPPNAVEAQQRTVARLRAKWTAARRRFGNNALLDRDTLLQSSRRPAIAAESVAVEAVRDVLISWQGARSLATTDRLLVSCLRCRTATPIGLALVHTPDPMLLAVRAGTSISGEPRTVLQIAQLLDEADKEVETDAVLIELTMRRLRRYLAGLRARATLSDGAPPAAALAHRVASTITQLPRSARPRGVQLAGSIYSALRLARSAGDLALLEEVAERRQETARQDPLLWLQDTSDALNAAFFHRPHAEVDRQDPRTGIVAVLLGVGS